MRENNGRERYCKEIKLFLDIARGPNKTFLGTAK